jgi:hypothetical protein
MVPKSANKCRRSQRSAVGNASSETNAALMANALMPENLAERLTVKDRHDLFTDLMTLE